MLLSGFSTIDNNSNASKSTPYFSPESTKDTYIGYVNNTYDLVNNTLINNNINVNTSEEQWTTSVAYDPVNSHLYVATLSNNITVINTSNNNFVKNNTLWNHVSHGITGLYYDKYNNYLYVLSTHSENMTAINTTTCEYYNITLGEGAQAIAFSADNIYVLNSNYNNISILNHTNVFVKNLTLSFSPICIAYNSYNNLLYTTDHRTGNVSAINDTSGKIVANITVGAGYGIWNIVYNSINHNIYVQAILDNSVNIGNGLCIINSSNKIAGNISLDYDTHLNSASYTVTNMVFDKKNQNIYYADSGTSNISVISTKTNTTVGVINVGLVPYGMAFNSNKNCLYVINDESDTVKYVYIPDAYEITFKETGDLDTYSCAWGVTFDGITKYSDFNTMTFIFPNGHYGYNISKISGLKASPKSNSIIVKGKDTVININFSPINYYVVTFTEHGLPKGTIWYVNLTNGQYHSSNTSIISFNEPNGTYSYNVKATGSKANASSGQITVSGANINKTVSFNGSKNTIPSIYIYIIVGAIIVVAVGSVLFFFIRKKR